MKKVMIGYGRISKKVLKMKELKRESIIMVYDS